MHSVFIHYAYFVYTMHTFICMPYICIQICYVCIQYVIVPYNDDALCRIHGSLYTYLYTNICICIYKRLQQSRVSTTIMKTCNFEIAVSSICSSCFFFLLLLLFFVVVAFVDSLNFFFFRYFINDDNIVSLHILSMCIYSIYATTSCRSFHKIQVYN